MSQAEKAEKPTEEEPTQIIKIRAPNDSRMMLDSTKARCLFVEAEEGTPFRAVLAASYWVHLAPKLGEMDVIRIRSEADGWYAELLVLSTMPNGALVVALPGYPISLDDTGALPSAFTDKYLVEFKGFAKWRVVRREDAAVLKDKMASRSDAHRWLLENERMLLA